MSEFDNVDITWQDLQNNENGIIVIPWTFRSGYVNVTENGYVGQDADPNDYAFFERVFTGKQNVQVVWTHSTKIVKPTNVNRGVYNFQVGTYYYGELISGESHSGVEIDTVTDNDDFMALKDAERIKLRFDFPASTLLEDNSSVIEHQFFAKEKDKQRLYTIPEITGNKWLTIEDIQYFNNAMEIAKSDITACEVTFVSLGDKLRKSGRASEQYIQYGAPCEPFAKPYIYYTYDNQTNRRVKIVTLDENAKSYDKGVKFLQVEYLGLGAISGVSIIGRELTYPAGSTTPSFDTWKFLCPSTFLVAQNNDINHTGTPSKNFFYFPQCSTDMNTSIAWVENWKKQNDAIATNNMTGKLDIGIKSDWQSIETGTHKSNIPTAGTNNLFYDYMDENWKPLGWLPDGTTIPLQVGGNMYCDSDHYELNKDMNMLDIMNANSFAYLNQLDLPLGFRSSKPYKVSNMPIVGGLVAGIIGDRTMFPNTKQRAPMKIGCFMDCDIAGMLVNRGVIPSGDNDTVGMFLAGFSGEDAPKWLGTEASNTTLCFKLSDKIQINTQRTGISDTRIWDTKYLGQNTNENGEYLFSDHKPLLFNTNTNTKVQNVDTNGFVIDKILVQGIFAGKIKLTAYTTDTGGLKTPVWTTTVISNAQWTKSHRNWTTEITTGGWDERFIQANEPWSWPKFPSKFNEGQVQMNVTLRQFENYESTSVNPIFPQPITQLQGNWLHTWGRKDGSLYYNNFFTKNEEPVEVIKTYGDLGLANVNDRDTLLQNYSELRVNLGGTYFTGHMSDGGWSQDGNAFLSETDYKVINLYTGIYAYETNVDLISQGNAGLPIKKLDWNNDFVSFNARTEHEVGGQIGFTNSWFVNSYVQKLNVKVDLLDNNIKFTFKDISYICQKDPMSEEHLTLVDGWQNTFGWCPGWKLNDHRHLNINSATVVPFVTFTPR